MLCWLTGLTDHVHSASYKGPGEGSRDLMSKHIYIHTPLQLLLAFRVSLENKYLATTVKQFTSLPRLRGV